MNAVSRIALAVATLVIATQSAAQVTFYERENFEGRSFTTQNAVPNFGRSGFNDRASSVVVRSVSRNAQVRDERYAPAPQVTQDYGRWRNERLYQADVTSVRAVMGTPAQRCWIEREQVVQQERSGPNVGGAVIGAVIGGILGHQVGRNNGGQQVVTQNVQRCTSAPSQTRPDYWDVTYNFRGQEHRVQMNAAPGAQVTVNQNGEPRA